MVCRRASVWAVRGSWNIHVAVSRLPAWLTCRAGGQGRREQALARLVVADGLALLAGLGRHQGATRRQRPCALSGLTCGSHIRKGW